MTFATSAWVHQNEFRGHASSFSEETGAKTSRGPKPEKPQG